MLRRHRIDQALQCSDDDAIPSGRETGRTLRHGTARLRGGDSPPATGSLRTANAAPAAGPRGGAAAAAFPKLITGDFIEVTIVSIDEHDNSVTIEMDARISSKTTWGATNALHGGALGVSGKTQSHWTHLIPTWPRRQSIIINVRVSRARLPQETASLADVLLIQQGDVYYVTPNSPLDLIRTRFANGKEGRCWFEASRGSRLGM